MLTAVTRTLLALKEQVMYRLLISPRLQVSSSFGRKVIIQASTLSVNSPWMANNEMPFPDWYRVSQPLLYLKFLWPILAAISWALAWTRPSVSLIPMAWAWHIQVVKPSPSCWLFFRRIACDNVPTQARTQPRWFEISYMNSFGLMLHGHLFHMPDVFETLLSKSCKWPWGL